MFLLTRVAFAEHLDGGGHFLLADTFILLPLGGSFEPLSGQRTQVEVHENVAQRLQVVPSRLLCGEKGQNTCGDEERKGKERKLLF